MAAENQGHYVIRYVGKARGLFKLLALKAKEQGDKTLGDLAREIK